MACELIITLYEHVNFQGQHRTIVSDEDNFPNIGFNDIVSSVIIEKGCNYADHVVTFYEDVNYGGRSIGGFAPGKIPNLVNYNFNDIMSSLKITKSDPVVNTTCNLIITLYEHVNFQGQHRTIVSDENNFLNIGFNDIVSSVKIKKGCNYADHVVTFYENVNYGGRSIGGFAPCEIPNLVDYNFNDIMSSLKITKTV